jgi:His-Xaa-Ser system protein HxsD
MIEIKDKKAIIKINPEIYSINVIYNASYVFLDKAYIKLDGDPTKEITVIIEDKKKPNEKNNEKIAKDFLNELINYENYEKRAKETKDIREIFLKRVLLTNDPDYFIEEQKKAIKNKKSTKN